MCWSSHQSTHEVRGRARRVDPVSTPDHLRVGDADREAVIAQLQRHVGDGRLTLEEFEDRVEEVTASRTGADLRAALRDLPPVREETERPERRRVGVHPLLVVAGFLVVLSIAVGHLVIWPLFVFMFFGFGRRRHHEHGEEADSSTYA